MVGSLTILYGPMRSGKSSRVVSCYIQQARLKYSCGIYIPLMCKERLDPNYDENNRINIGGEIKQLQIYYLSHIDSNKLTIISDDEIQKMMENDYIYIDESQFIVNIVPVVLTLLSNRKNVTVVSLCGDYLGNVIGYVYMLIPHAKIVEKMNGICELCKNDNTFNTSITSARDNYKDKDIIDITGQFVACCFEHARVLRSN